MAVEYVPCCQIVQSMTLRPESGRPVCATSGNIRTPGEPVGRPSGIIRNARWRCQRTEEGGSACAAILAGRRVQGAHWGAYFERGRLAQGVRTGEGDRRGSYADLRIGAA